jgi:superoxide dismutase, Fe-Mn family
MNKREFIKTGFLGTLGLLSLPSIAKSKNELFAQTKEFLLPELPYAYDALEPFIDKETMMLHHSKHHAAYTDKFNAAIKEAGLAPASVREVLINASKYSAPIVDNGGGYLNHKIFWKSMSPNGGGMPQGRIAELITRDFESYDRFKELFTAEAKNIFGSGWAWLVYDKDALKIVTTANQYNPIMDIVPFEKRGVPLLCLDVWEHAYYLKYQNRRAEYIDAFWNIINWEAANIKLAKSSIPEE